MKFILLAALVCLAGQTTGQAINEKFGYVDISEDSHMFYVMYYAEDYDNWMDYPLIMWLQGGPGASGVGYGNFEELGPVDINGVPREGAWTKKANVLFVDNPVGSGYSYVDNLNSFTKTNQDIADDLVVFMKSFLALYPDFEKIPFFVYAESYGGKMAADFALTLDVAIKAGEVKCNLQGVGLGDSWVSPMDSVNTWGEYLYQTGFVSRAGLQEIEAAAADTQAACDAGDWVTCTDLWGTTEGVVLDVAGDVDFYNILVTYPNNLKDRKTNKDISFLPPNLQDLYRRRVGVLEGDELGDFMNGEQADHWNIPADVTWGGQSGLVFFELQEDFMKPVVDSVVSLLTETDLHVAVYSGNLDLICDTPGTLRWVEKMNWVGLPDFMAAPHEVLYVTSYSNAAAFVQRSGQLSFFSILRSGHMVPADAPEMCLNMIDIISQYASESKSKAKITSEVKEEVKDKVQQLKEKAAEAKVEDVKVPMKLKGHFKAPVKAPITKESKVEAVEALKAKAPLEHMLNDYSDEARLQAFMERRKNIRGTPTD